MNRRTFVTVLATLCAWPFTRLRAHENAVKAIPKPAELANWHPSDEGMVLCKVWDNYSRRLDREPVFVRSAYMRAPHRRRLAFTPGVDGVDSVDIKQLGPDSTVFRLEAIDQVQEADGKTHTTYHYDYVSGPKWWEPARPQWAFIGHLPDGDVRCFQRKHARWEHLASYQFTHVTFVEGHGLSGQERALVISRIRTKPGEPLTSIRFEGTPVRVRP